MTSSAPLRRVVLLEHRNRLANQLWNAIAVHAYAEERGFAFEDVAALDYHRHFELPDVRSRLSEAFLDVWDFTAPRFGRVPFRTKVLRVASDRVGDFLRGMPARLARSGRAPLLEASSPVFYLAPSPSAHDAHRARLSEAERSGSSVIGVRGWLFRNPVGIVKHRSAILSRLTPNSAVERRVTTLVERARAGREHLIGVHLRRGDYVEWLGGKLVISEARANEAVRELLERRGMRATSTRVLVCSDAEIDLSAFRGVGVMRSTGSAIEDLLALARCDVILGSNSTFGGFASYYGDVPLVVLQRGAIDWAHYDGRGGFFEDKYFIVNALAGSQEEGDPSILRE